MKGRELRESKLAHWRRTQSAWDDAEFLAHEANAFMKLRWRRLNARCAAVAAQEARRLGRGIDLLDVGCAHADFRDWCQSSLRSYTGLEPSRALLPKDRKGPGFLLKRGQAEALPFKPQSFDMVLIKEVLDHCWGPEKVLAGALRCLRPEGLCLVTLTNDRAWYKSAMPGLAGRIKAGQDDHLYYFHPAQVRDLLRGAGFAPLGQEDSHYLRLPYRVEEAMGRLPEAMGRAVLTLSDAVGGLLAPERGGSFWAWGRRPLREGA